MPVEWMADVALLDLLAAEVLFLAGLSTERKIRVLAFMACAWCLIEVVGHAWMENTVARFM